MRHGRVRNWVRSAGQGSGGRLFGRWRSVRWWLRWRGPGRQEPGRGFATILGIGLTAEALQLGERPIIRALRGIDAALQAGEAIAIAAVDIAEGGVFIQFGERGLAGVFH